MRFLKKILIALALVIILALLKWWPAGRYPEALVFTANLPGCLQLLVLAWAVWTGILEGIIPLQPTSARRLSWVLFLALTLMGEAACGWWVHHPRSIPSPLRASFRYFYDNYQRDILQYNRGISAYDSGLFYRMKPSSRALFSNIEFSDSILTDARGFRQQDTAGTPAYRILCLGDSYTLGWGVPYRQSYPFLLSASIGLPVLNTGMSSYGTAREVASVRGLPMDSVSAVVIQYSYNDQPENDRFRENGFSLVVSPPSVYDSACRSLQWSRFYFPGKYLLTISKIFLGLQLHHWLESRRGSAAGIQDSSLEKKYNDMAEGFLAVVKRSGWNFNKLHLYVFDVCEYESMNDLFAQALEKKLALKENRDFFKEHLHVLHLAGRLQPADYYILDGHVRASGQQKIAAMLDSCMKMDASMAGHSKP
jgi:hypothetical protein